MKLFFKRLWSTEHLFLLTAFLVLFLAIAVFIISDSPASIAFAIMMTLFTFYPIHWTILEYVSKYKFWNTHELICESKINYSITYLINRNHELVKEMENTTWLIWYFYGLCQNFNIPGMTSQYESYVKKYHAICKELDENHIRVETLQNCTYPTMFKEWKKSYKFESIEQALATKTVQLSRE